MLPQILGVDEGHAMHRTESLGLFHVYIRNAQDEVFGLNIQAFSQRNVFVQILTEFAGFAFNIKWTIFVEEKKYVHLASLAGL